MSDFPEFVPVHDVDPVPRTAEEALTLSEQHVQKGDFVRAQKVIQWVADSDDPLAPKAMLIIGAIDGLLGEVAAAAVAYQKVLESGHAGYAAEAAFALGRLQAQQGDRAGAEEMYMRALSSAIPRVCAPAAYELALLLIERGDVAKARNMMQVPIRFGAADQASRATNVLAELDWLAALDTPEGDGAPEHPALRRARQVLRETDWASLYHAYGSAADAPERLADLMATDPTVRADTRFLTMAAVHQGSLTSCTAPAAVVVAGALHHANTELPLDPPFDASTGKLNLLRVELLDWLTDVTEISRAVSGEVEAYPEQEVAAARACIAVFPELRAAVAALTSNPRADVREAAEKLLAALSNSSQGSAVDNRDDR